LLTLRVISASYSRRRRLYIFIVAISSLLSFLVFNEVETAGRMDADGRGLGGRIKESKVKKKR
jgi:hypothetical protein